MRISILFSSDAGAGVSSRELREAVEKGGHEIVSMVEKTADPERIFKGSTELVVAAGGDGTVRRAAIAVAGRGIPLAILPLGTANNIAKSLGTEGSISELIADWSHASHCRLDLGIVRGDWGESRFLEGIGGGLIPAGIAAMENRSREAHEDDRADTHSKIARAVRTYREVLSRLKPRRWTTTVDGMQLDEELLLFEVLNVRSIGPNLMLSPDVDHSDGFLSVVTASEEHRGALAGYLAARLEGSTDCLCLPTRRAGQIEIQFGAEMHVDDEVRPWSQTALVSIRIEPAALEYVASGRTSHA